MRVDTGGDPGRDDYGLPPVDIDVPDDARELGREVQAYYRELRSRRRRTLARKVYGPLASDGMVLPLLAGCLALTLLAATLLTVFTVGQGTVGGPAAHAHAPPGRSVPQGHVGGLLPDALVLVNGQPMYLRDITGLTRSVVVLALIPPGCKCLSDLLQLIQEAGQQNGVQTYLVGTRSAKDVTQLSNRTGFGRWHVVVAERDPLPAFYSARTTLTAVLVRPDGSLARVISDQHGFQIAAELRSLAVPGSGQPSMTPASPAG
jgi:hypothetical protein